MKPTKFLYVGAICLLFTLSASAQIRINEILVSNASVNTDPQYGAYSDWVELYNAGNTDINLKGYYITDNYNNTTKWQINKDTTLTAKGYMLIWCDDKSDGLHTNFKLSADGEEIALYSPTLELLDSLSFAAQFVDISYGRQSDGSSSLGFFMQPTPAAANSTQAYTGCANQPEIMTLGGFYNSPVQVVITQDLGGTVRYTLDGSEPTAESTAYTAPFTVSKTTVVRARIFQEGLIPGKIMTSTYFIGEGFEKHSLPVVSLSTNAANFWDSSKGIYAQDFKPDWEVPVNIELFENNGSDRAAVNELSGVKINGLYSWQLPQKMLGVYFRKQYGESKLSYNLFMDHSRSSFKNFALRASGNDWSNTLFRDGLLQQACRRGNTNLDLMAFRPSIVYLNGAFLGIHNIREKVDDDYISSNYGIEKGTFDMIEGGDYVETGDMAAWDSLATITGADLSQQANFDALANCFDVENFTDYIVAELFCRNTSLAHNTMAWKPKGSGKWRWVLMDADRGFFSYGNDLLTYYKAVTVWPLNNMMKNSNYKSYICRRIANQLFTTFNPITMLQQIDEHQKDIATVIPQQVARWLGTTSSYGNAMPSVDYWYNEVERLRTYVTGRPPVLMQDLTSYGCSAPALLSLTATPGNACTWLFNEMKAGNSTWWGYYPTAMPITLTAQKKAGYNFVGWRENSYKEIVPKADTWKYLDDGTNQGTNWRESSFDDSSWKSGQAPLGYSLSLINTKVSYGSSSSNKYITTYFRKSFTVDTPLSQILSIKMELLREDGAVVFLNGKKILSSNMPVATEPDYKTLAEYALGSLAETTYVPYDVKVSDLKEGENVLAVEVHQAEASSSDMGFDMHLFAEVEGTGSSYVSTDETLQFSLEGNRSLTAIYESNGQNVVPDSINRDTTFYKAHSPYIVQNDVYIGSGAKLTIEPGVQVWMAPGTHFYIHGSMQAQGSESDTILFRLNPAYDAANSWGALCFINTSDTTRLSYMELRDATRGPRNYNCVAAISGFHTILRLDHMRITDVDSNPIAARYSDVQLTNSTIHSSVLGDLINVKYGKGHIENSTFLGNGFPDTDGIDFDGVTNGVIKKVIIHNLSGSNSDAIDLGEGASNVQIDSVMLYNVTDKGVSVGQRTTAILSHSTIINTNLGVGVKDSSRIEVKNCTFYSVNTPIACYEKIFGRAGGNAVVTNSILSNSYDHTILCDKKSWVYIANSLSDNDSLPAGQGNINNDPDFVSAGSFDLHLTKPFPIALGSNYMPIVPEPELMIVEIGYNTLNLPGRAEYIALYNPTPDTLDISSYALSKAVEYTFPQGSLVPPHALIYVTKSAADLSLLDKQAVVYEWTKGSLANEGEAVCVKDGDGFIIDQVAYGTQSPWPVVVVEGDAKVLSLTNYMADNHLAKYWEAKPYPTGIKDVMNDERPYLTAHSSTGSITVHLPAGGSCPLTIYTLTGIQLLNQTVTDGETIDLSKMGSRIVMVSVGGHVVKVVVMGHGQ